ncbi:MAG: ABC transporter substrate-binding protein [Synechococcales bacterium]|nr:ABC transporter substrate-binding protein [Synechococcales bacterium]
MMTRTEQRKSSAQKLPPIAWLGISLTVLMGLGSGIRWLSGFPIAGGQDASQGFLRQSVQMSRGKGLFFPQDGTMDKTAAKGAFANQDYATAAQLFRLSLQRKPNDPEARIYFNNANASEANPLQLAVSVPISNDANGAKEILRGVAQAQQEINQKGGVKGRPIYITIANDGDDPQLARQIATEFVNDPRILGVVGHYASSVTLATAEIYDRGQLVAISPISSAVQLSHKSSYVFRTLPNDAVAARSLADYTIQTLNRKKPVVYFNSQSDYSKSLMSEFRNAIAQQNGQVVAEYDLSNTNLSASQSLQEAQLKGADVVMLASNTGSLDRAIQVMQANQARLPLLGGDDVYTPKTLEVSQAAAEDLVVAVPWHGAAANSQAFADRSRQWWGGDVNWRTVTAYDATMALIAGLEANPTRQGVQQALTQPTFTVPGASHSITFLPSGDRNIPVQLVKVVRGRRSGFGYDFIPIDSNRAL